MVLWIEDPDYSIIKVIIDTIVVHVRVPQPSIKRGLPHYLYITLTNKYLVQ